MEFIKLGVEYNMRVNSGNDYTYTRATIKQVVMGVDGVPIMLLSSEGTIYNWQNIISLTEMIKK